MTITGQFAGDSTAAVHGSARMRTIPCPWRSLIDPLLAKATRSGAPQQSQAFVPSSCGLEAGLNGCGTSGLHNRARRFRLVILKAARWRSAPEFHEVRYFKSASIIGEIRPSDTNPAGTITRPGLASGTSRQESGRKRNLQMFTIDGVGRTLLSDAFGFALLPDSMLFSLTMDDQNFEICTHLSDKSVRPTSACKIEVPCSSRNNSTSS